MIWVPKSFTMLTCKLILHTPLGQLVDAKPVTPTVSSMVANCRPTILVVEDDDAVRSFVKIVLEQAHYAVLSAANANQASTIYRDNHDVIDLVLSDVVMPGRSGAELATELRALDSEVPIVFMSGFPGGTTAHPVQLPSGSDVLAKPFTIDQLLKQVRRRLASSE